MPHPWLHLVNCGHFAHNPDHYMARTCAPDDLLIWVLAGRGHGTLQRLTVQAEPGDLLVFPKGLAHAYGSDPQDPWDILWVHFDGAAATHFMHPLAVDGQLRLSLGLDPHLRERFEELVQLHADRDPAMQELCSCLLWGLLGLIVHRIKQPPAQRDEYHTELRRGLSNYIRDHLTQNLDMEDLAKVAGVSPRHATRLFHQLFQASPMQYVHQQRLARAATLLTETDWSVKKIALEVGCPDPYYFSRLFRKHMHLSPKQWRHAHNHTADTKQRSSS